MAPGMTANPSPIAVLGWSQIPRKLCDHKRVLQEYKLSNGLMGRCVVCEKCGEKL